MTGFIVRRAEWGTDTKALRSVRTRVFIEEQHVTVELEWDGLDEACMHALAVADGKPIGTGRLTPDGHIGRMAVVPEWRQHGVGAALLEHLLQAARERGDQLCELNAQVTAIGFYERFGFEALGGEFMDAGIPHRVMRLYYDGDAGTRVNGYYAMRETLLEVARTVRHEFALYAPDLAPRLTADTTLAEILRDLALGNRRNRVRLLVRDARIAASEGHPLLHLVAALPSHCELRQLNPKDEPDDQVYAFNDTGASLRQPRAETPEGLFVPESLPTAKALRKRFDLLWERSEPAPDARRLEI